jgi:trimethylamine:corrinoid methyltransferase-like protein
MIERKVKAMDIFTDEEVLQIHAASMEIMEKNGIEFLSEEARKILQDNGVRVEGKKHSLKKAKCRNT